MESNGEGCTSSSEAQVVSKQPWIIIDCNYICNVSKYAMKNQDLSHNGKPTAIIYNFLTILKGIFQKFEYEGVAFVWDDNQSGSFRTVAYPEYKNTRRNKVRTMDEIEYEKIAKVQYREIYEKVIPMLGYKNNLMQIGLEGDDLMAMIHICHPSVPLIFVTNDKDMYQILNPRRIIYNPVSGKMITHKDVELEWGIEASRWGEVLAISGCRTDDVAGIQGVHFGTAIKFLKGELKRSSKAWQKITSDEGKEIRNRNTGLVVLPHKNTLMKMLEYDRISSVSHCISIDAFIYMCKQYGFNSFLSEREIQGWITSLKLQ